jgi:hypothetical protein
LDGAGHDLDRFLVGEALLGAQGAPGPERDGVADDGADPAPLPRISPERRGQKVDLAVGPLSVSDA